MFVRNVYINKHSVRFCPSTMTAKEALDFLRETGYRCIPVVDPETNQYKGQIYKVHLLEHLFENSGSPDASVLEVVTEKDSFVHTDKSLIMALLHIDRLPFLAVVDDQGMFAGIITHTVIMDLFRDGFGMKTGGHCFTVAVGEHAGAFRKLLDLLSNYNIEGAHTFDNGSRLVRRLTFTLSPQDANEEVLNKIQEKLEKSGVRVLHIEKIEKQ